MKKRGWVIIGFMVVFVTLLIPLGGEDGSARQEKWVARYNGPGNGTDHASALAVDSSGNVYVTGYSSASGSYGFATIKYNTNGKRLWGTRYYGPYGYDALATALAVDGSGNVYVTGYGKSDGTSGDDYAIVKYSPSGKQLWAARYNSFFGRPDKPCALAVDGSGNVYVTGWCMGSDLDNEYLTVKYSTNGQLLWVKRYDGSGSGDDAASAIVVDGSGNVYVTGYSCGSGGKKDKKDYATVKYNTDGKQLWVKRYNGPGKGWDGARALAVDGSGNVYVTGDSEGSGTYGNSDYATIKYNTNGKQLWAARYNGPANDWDIGWAIAVDGSGNVYVTGYSGGSGTADDFATIKYNPNGKQIWANRYNGPDNLRDVASAIAVDGSGNVYVTGLSSVEGPDYNYCDYATIKYSPGGLQLWVKTYNGPGNKYDWPCGISVDSRGNVYVTGTSEGSSTGEDYATIKY